MSLIEKFQEPARRERVVDACVALVDVEVEKKKGFGGIVIKTGYGAVKGIKPGFVRKVVDGLFDRWAAKLAPFWDAAEASGKSPVAHLVAERAAVADALLSVTDEKAQRADHAIVASTYKKLRPSAKEHVEEAVPALAELIDRHARS
ncbi:MAG: hypothetical protein FJ095_09730 [Deltaproteobacteria bacterium]|nr:hypothetical protein [Deltaproteobacteria bacterium]